MDEDEACGGDLDACPCDKGREEARGPLGLGAAPGRRGVKVVEGGEDDAEVAQGGGGGTEGRGRGHGPAADSAAPGACRKVPQVNVEAQREHQPPENDVMRKRDVIRARVARIRRHRAAKRMDSRRRTGRSPAPAARGALALGLGGS